MWERKLFYEKQRTKDQKKKWEKAWENILTNKKWKESFFFLSEKENQRPTNIEKKHEKTYWQTKNEKMAEKIKVCNFDKRTENKNNKKLKKAFACQKEN